MFKVDSVRSIIIDAEREWLDDSPFKGITKLLEISKICKTPSKMEWVLKSVVNRIKAGSMDTGEFTLRNLAGRQGKQWCEVLLKQRELRTHMLGPFIDSRNIIPAAKLKIREVFASPDSYVEKLRPLADEEDAGLDTSWQASLPRSAHLTLELIEQTCFSMSGVEDQLLRVGIRNGKIAEEILSEYSPFKESVKAIDDALLQEHQAIVKQKKEAQDDSTTDNRLATAAEPDDVTLVDEVPSHVEDQRAAHAKRILASFLVLEVEGTRSQTALAGDLAKHALVKVKGDETSGNVMIIFDVNGFGETMTAPHIRRPPITQEVLRKLYKSLNFARHGEAEPTIVPEGEVHVVLDGGRKNNAVFSKIFGAGPGMKRVKTPGPRTLVRQTLVLLSEPSVRARKMRHTKGRVCFNCTQGMLWWYNSHTLIPTRSHKFLPDWTNASNVYGPVALESWPSLPTLTVADKKKLGQAARGLRRQVHHRRGPGRRRWLHGARGGGGGGHCGWQGCRDGTPQCWLWPWRWEDARTHNAAADCVPRVSCHVLAGHHARGQCQHDHRLDSSVRQVGQDVCHVAHWLCWRMPDRLPEAVYHGGVAGRCDGVVGGPGERAQRATIHGLQQAGG